jgi:hypothetical protein
LLRLEHTAAQAQPQSELSGFTPALLPALAPGGWLTSSLRFGEKVSTAGTQVTPLAEIGSQSLNPRRAVYISPAAFHPAGDTPADSFLFWPEGGYLYNVSDSPLPPTLLLAPVALPHGVTLTRFSLVLFDNDPANDVTAILYRKNLLSNLTGPAEAVMALGQSLVNPTQLYQLSTTSIDPAKALVSPAYSYYIVFQLNPETDQNQLIFGFSLEYEGDVASNVEVIPAAAFRPNGPQADQPYFDFGAGFVRNRSEEQLCLLAPLSPPAGATLTELRASLFDNSDDKSLQLQLHRLRLATGQTDLLATLTSTGTATSPASSETVPAPLSVGVAENDSYYLSACFEAENPFKLALIGARLFYTPALTTGIQTQAVRTRVLPVPTFIGTGETGDELGEPNNWLMSLEDGFLTADDNSRSCLAAPLLLPVGSVLQNFTVYIEDDFNPADLTVFLDRTSFLGEWRELGRVVSQDGGGLRAITAVISPTADKIEVIAPYSNYHLNFCLPPFSDDDLKIYGAKVAYLSSGTPTELYFPVLFQATLPPPSSLSLFLTNLTPNPLTYTVFNPAQGNLTCAVPGGATAYLCGSPFTAGSYSFRTHATCGQKIGQHFYRPISESLTPFRCD